MNSHCCEHVHEALHALASMSKPRSNNTNAQQLSSSLQRKRIKSKSGTRQYFHSIKGGCGTNSSEISFITLISVSLSNSPATMSASFPDPVTGKCNCGAIGISIPRASFPAFSGLCHCNDCKVSSGSWYIPFLATHLHRLPFVR